jgi:hypothetical protein
MTHPLEIDDMCFEIGRNLPFVEVLYLSKHRIIKGHISFKDLFIKRLCEMGMDNTHARAFNEHLVKCQAVVSGSFLLSILVTPMNQPLLWNPDDIDVYCYQADEDYICPHCNGTFARASKFAEFTCQHKYKPEGGMMYPLLSIIENRCWTKGDVVINELIIDKKVKSLKDFIFDTFDFNFCKSTYDGTTLSVFDIDSIREKKCIYRGDKEALKYFSQPLTDSYSVEDPYRLPVIYHDYNFRMYRLYSTYKFRKDKYEERGFTIDCQFKFGKQYMSDYYTEDRIKNFADEINGEFVDAIDHGWSDSSYVTFGIRNVQVDNFIGTDKPLTGSFRNPELITSEMRENGKKIDGIIRKHFPRSEYGIDEHPSYIKLFVYLINT